MRALLRWTLATMVVLGGISLGQTAVKAVEKDEASDSSRQKLIGTWRLVSLQEPGADGKMNLVTDRKGVLIYTQDGHMSVQLMLPPSESGVSNDYVKDGYEASFCSYDVNEEARTVTHHIQGSVTRGLVGKDLPRAFQFSGKQLIIKSTRPDEHWSVTWEHY